MRLRELLPHTMHTHNPDIAGLAAHTRDVQPGFIFAALPNLQTDHTNPEHISEAVRRGAVAVIARPDAGDHVRDAVLIPHDNPRKHLAALAARFHSPHPTHKLAVTGTDGKTSVAALAQNLLADTLGASVGYIGTLGNSPKLDSPDSPLTTPDPVTLARKLAEMKRGGVDHVVLEASSHGLHQERLSGFKFSAACFTGIGRDHGDYHPTPEEYLLAKSRLFTELLAPDATAVICDGCDGAAKVAALLSAERPDVSIVRYQTNNGDTFIVSDDNNGGAVNVSTAPDNGDTVNVPVNVGDTFIVPNQIKEFHHTREGASVVLQIGKHTRSVNVPFYARFQAENLLAALLLSSCVINDSEATPKLMRAAESVSAIPGRLQRITPPPSHRLKDCEFFVDFAHTPDAVAGVLHALRERRRALNTQGRLIIVLGAGGDRDQHKRAPMGKIAATLADTVVITDDNPRGENPADIRAEILRGTERENADAVNVSRGREAAIESAVSAMKAGDTLVVTGKGHETTQHINDSEIPLSDADTLNNALAK